MIEVRWVLHNPNDGAPAVGAICVGERIYQKLQYRRIVPRTDVDGVLYASTDWTEWIDVPYAGMPNAKFSGTGERSLPGSAGTPGWPAVGSTE